MDMSTVKGLTINEGSVNQITGPDGQIWWLAANANKVYYNMKGDHYFPVLNSAYDVTSVDSLNAQYINIQASTKSYDLMKVPNGSNVVSATVSGTITSSASGNYTCEITLGDYTVINPVVSTTSNVDYAFSATAVSSWSETKQVLNIRIMNSNYSYLIEIYFTGSKVMLKTYGSSATSGMRTVTIKNLQVILNYN